MQTMTADQNRELLNDVLYGAMMGQKAVEVLKTKTDDPNVQQALDSQLGEYEGIANTARDEMNKRGYPIESQAMCESTMSFAIHANTLVNRTPDHLAELMINGSSMGIIDTTRARNRYQNADPEVAGLAQHLIEVEQQNIDDMKSYLT